MSKYEERYSGTLHIQLLAVDVRLRAGSGGRDGIVGRDVVCVCPLSSRRIMTLL